MSSIVVTLPEPHPAQATILSESRRFNIVACGRRFGKSELAILRLTETALDGEPAAYFAPTYKMLAEVWRQATDRLAPVITSANVQERRIELLTGGTVDFWSLDSPNSARGRKYARAIIDEAAMIGGLEDAWNAVIRPTLTDLHGDADFYSTPKGRGFFWTAYTYGEDPNYPEWECWRFPTVANPYIDPAEVEAARSQLPERTFAQEYLAEFLDEAGGVFRKVREAVDPGRSEADSPRKGDQYVTGVDLARVQDFTVLSVLDGAGRQAYFERFNQISWDRQIEAIKAVNARYPGPVIVDSTGVGDPICEALRRADVRIIPYQFTNQSKEAAIDRLALRLEQGQIRLMDVSVQTNELLAFQYELTPSRNVRMNAPQGMHDDTVMALSLASWGLERFATIAETAEQAEARERAEAEARERAQDEWMNPSNPAVWGDDD